MNLEEANANIGKEVIYIGRNKEVISAFNGKKLLISYPTKNMETNVLIEYDDLCFWNIPLQDLKLKEKPMKNYKIKVTPATSAEVQELFFELGYAWNTGSKMPKYQDYSYIYTLDEIITVTDHIEIYDDLKAIEITLPQLHDIVVLKRNDVGDATHIGRSGSQYYRGYKDYRWNGSTWIATSVNLVNVTPIIKQPQMTWEDALREWKDGKEVEALDIDGWFNLEEWELGTLRNAKCYRLSPQRKELNGKFTKEELLKIAGEME